MSVWTKVVFPSLEKHTNITPLLNIKLVVLEDD
jgi:hypothetical protein